MSYKNPNKLKKKKNIVVKVPVKPTTEAKPKTETKPKPKATLEKNPKS